MNRKHLWMLFFGFTLLLPLAHGDELQNLRAANRAVCLSKFRVKDIEAEMKRLQREKPNADLSSLRADRDSVAERLLPQLRERDRALRALKGDPNQKPELPQKEICDKWGERHLDGMSSELKAAATGETSVMTQLKTYLGNDRSSEAQANGNSGSGRGAAQVVPQGNSSGGTESSGSGN